MRPQIAALLLGCISFSLAAQDQPKTIHYRKDADARRHLVFDMTKKEASDAPASKRFIVSLTGEALTSGRVSAQQIEKSHERFLKDFEKITASGRTDVSARILFEYRKVFNGFAIEVSNTVKEQIARLDYVLAVTEDQKVEAFDEQSNAVINADKVWQQYGLKGSNIRIGIIDTGIDYNHPDLGGGFGPAFKVKGGYDFVNDDADPFDDHGHGTHVAGIAAADGASLQGVAPKADLYAFKVLNAEGYGFDSWIIAGIERTLDPDQNPSTDDRMHVVNMSLGKLADANDPLNVAVNNAVSQGVVFVIAAGNSFDHFTIGTPGSAEKAITVAAIDNSEQRNTAFFSSRGPTSDYRLKPDISAPGVSIFSSYLNGGHTSLDGTSMASPHVAGAAALLLEKNPSWSPAQIKAALMNTAQLINLNFFEQGAGCVNILAAMESGFHITPSSISLGRLDTSIPITTKTFTLTLHNTSPQSQVISLESAGPIVEQGGQVKFSQNSVNIPANGSEDITATFTLPKTLSFKSFPEMYWGFIVAKSPMQAIRIPVGLVHSSVTTFVFDNGLPMLFKMESRENNQIHFPMYSPTSSRIEFPIPPGTYDFIAFYRSTSTLDVAEETVIELGKDREIHFAESHAKNALVFRPRDINGQDLTMFNGTRTMASLFSEKSKFAMLWEGMDTLRISDVKHYTAHFVQTGSVSNDPATRYEIFASTPTGIFESSTFQNDTSNFASFIIKNPNISTGAWQDLTYYYADDWTISYYPPSQVPNPFRILHVGTQQKHVVNRQYIKLEAPGTVPLQINSFQFRGDSVRFVRDNEIPFDIRSGKNEYTPGESLVGFNGPVIVEEQSISLYNFSSPGYFNCHLGDHTRDSLSYTLKAGEVVVKRGRLINNDIHDHFSTPRITLDDARQSQRYELNFNYQHYQVQDKISNVDVTFEFDVRLNDRDAPYFQSLHLELDGKSVNHFSADQSPTLNIVVSDDCERYFDQPGCASSGIAGVTAKFKSSDAQNWIELNLDAQSNGKFSVRLPEGLSDGYYDLELTGLDQAGNSVSYVAAPAFAVGNFTHEKVDFVTLISPAQYGFTKITPTFSWEPIEGATFHLEVSATEDFSSPVIDEYISASTFTAGQHLNFFVGYYWRVSATAPGKFIHPSGVRFFSPAADRVQPIFPANGATGVPTNVPFQWTPAEFSSDYAIEVSSTNSFISPLVTAHVTEPNYLLVDLPAQTTYYWRVISNYNFNGMFNQNVSDTFQFNTNTITGNEGFEFLSKLTAFPNPFTTEVSIAFHLNRPGRVKFRVVDAMGREIFSEDPNASAGNNVIRWKGVYRNGQTVPNGVYLAQIHIGNEVHHVRMVLRR